jgi:GNAT superfamily N-acetyltransferase
MVRKTLDDIPEFPMPTGYSYRCYRPGDEEHWFRIHLAADRFNTITPELFRERFGSDTSLLAQRQLYLLDASGFHIGTGTAWFPHGFRHARTGRVHWLAVVPEQQGRGLGKALMTVLCRRLRELGHDRAYLFTLSARVAAIRLYLGFGFEAWPMSPADRALWQMILDSRAT